MTNDLSTLFRYGLPGWVALMVMFLPHLLALLTGVTTWSSAPDSIDKPSLEFLLGGVALTVPLGFTIYQLYFFWSWTQRSDWPGTQRDPPSQITSGTPLQEFMKDAKGRELNLDEQWFIVEMCWYELLAKMANQDAATRFAERARHLLDVYHSLGTLLTSLFIGGLCIVLSAFSISTRMLLMDSRVALPLIVLLACLSFAVWRNRCHVRENMNRFMRHIFLHF